MATSSPSILYDNSTDALFRAWGQAFDTAMLAVGWVAAADTGQIDFTTVLKPSAATQSRGFKMYQSNDGGTTFYLKVEFGSNGFGALGPALFISTGWATDGAGALSGVQKSGRYEVRLTNGNAAANFTVALKMCYTDGASAFALNEDGLATNAYSPCMILDRYRDVTTGAALNTGLFLAFATNNSTNAIIYNGTTGMPKGNETIPASGGAGWGAFSTFWVNDGYPSSTVSWGRGLRKGLGVFYPWDAGPLAPTIAAVAVSPVDDSTGSVLKDVSLYGTLRDYRVHSGTYSTSNFGAIAIIWR